MIWLSNEEYKKSMKPVWEEESRQKALRREEAKKLLKENGIGFEEQTNKMLVVRGAERQIYYAPGTGKCRFKGESKWDECSSAEEFIARYFPDSKTPSQQKAELEEELRRMAEGLATYERQRNEHERAECAAQEQATRNRSGTPIRMPWDES
jgi:predicted ribosome quality control (RQC) complex YloA/Tae2 family protein